MGLCRRSAAVFAAVLLAFCGRPALASIADQCHPAASGSVAVLTNQGGRLLVPVLVDNHEAIFELDTGADLSLMAPAMAQGLGLPLQRSFMPLLAGADGRPLTDYVKARSVSLGGQSRDAALFVVPPRWSVLDSRVTGMLGGDVLHDWDIELDLGNQQVRFYPQSHCLGMTPPFGGGGDTVPINSLMGHIVVPVQLNGHTLQALLDTGATNSSMSLEMARRFFGLAPGVSGVTESGVTITTDGGRLQSWTYRFNQLLIGRTRLDQPSIDLVAEDGRHMVTDHDMVLGLSELRQMHLYIAYGQNKLSIAREQG